MKVKEKIVNILSIIFIVTLFLMSFTFIIFHNTDSATALKDAWSTLGSFFGGIATLTTAYVASLLFNDWKQQHNKSIDAERCIKAIDFFQQKEFELVEVQTFIIHFLQSPIKLQLHTQFQENLNQLTKIANETAIVLSNLGYVIPKEAYNTKYLPQFDNLIKDIEYYIEVYDNQFRHYQVDAHTHKYIKKYLELTEQLRSRYRATAVELAEYYKALE